MSALERTPETRLNTSHHSDGKVEVPQKEPHPGGGGAGGGCHTELFLCFPEPQTLSLSTEAYS